MIRKVSPYFVCAVLAALFTPCAASAQTASTDIQPQAPEAQGSRSSDASPADQVGDVIVTAQRRTERLQDVPVSVQVVSGEVLAEQNRNTLESLTRTVPGVHVSSSGTFANQLYVRGIGSSGNPAFDQSVATFVDGVYLGRSRATGGVFLDLDRIEVLKGPQTTYFGNNAIAGALNIITKRPGATFDGYARGLYGTHGQYAAETGFTVPISDTLGVRLAGIAEGGSGWIRNTNTGRLAPERHNYSGRATVAFRPSDAFDATLKFEASSNLTLGTDLGLPQQWANCPAPAPIGADAPGVFCAQAIAQGVPRDWHDNLNSGLSGQRTKLTTQAGTLTLNYHLGDTTLTSVSALSHYDYLGRGDQIGFPIWLNTHQQTEYYDQFSQELRVTSPTGQPLEYLFGAYFQDDRLYQDFAISAPFTNGLGPVLGVPAQYLPLVWDPGLRQNEQVYSAFGALTWNVTERLKLTGALRWSEVDKHFRGFNRYGYGAERYGYTPVPTEVEKLWSVVQGPPGTSDLKRSDDAWQPSARVQYQFAPDVMAYASYTRGFKAGGYNGVVPVAEPANLQFGPEHVDAYEVGLKSKLFGNKVLLNLAAFRSDYSDLQVDAQVFLPAVNGYSIVVRNAAQSRAQGIELESQWAVTRDFRLGANLTYLDSKYVSYPNASPSALQTFCKTKYVEPYCSVFPNPVPSFRSLKGQRTAFAPEWSASFLAAYSFNIAGGYRATLETTPYYSSEYNTFEEPYVLGTHAYVRLDARIGLTSPNKRWALDLIGKNLTNEDIIANASIYVAQKEEPRNVALQLRFNW